MTCGVFGMHLFGGTDSESMCGYYWFREYAMIEIWALSSLWFVYSFLYSACNSGEDPAPARSAFIRRYVCCGMNVFSIEVFVWLISCCSALLFPELAILFFLFMLIGTGWDYKGVNAPDAAKAVVAQAADAAPTQVNGAGFAARFDSIRPRIQFPVIKYKQVPTDIV